MRKLYVKSLNDGTQGFRFRVFGLKGLTRKRQSIKRWGVSHGSSMTAYHMGKRRRRYASASAWRNLRRVIL